MFSPCCLIRTLLSTDYSMQASMHIKSCDEDKTNWQLIQDNPPPSWPPDKRAHQPAEPSGVSKGRPEVVDDQPMSTADCLAPAEQGCHLLALSRLGLRWRPSALPSPCQYTLGFAAQLLAVHQLGQLHIGIGQWLTELQS